MPSLESHEIIYTGMYAALMMPIIEVIYRYVVVLLSKCGQQFPPEWLLGVASTEMEPHDHKANFPWDNAQYEDLTGLTPTH